MARRNQSFDGLSPEERNRADGEKEMKIVQMGIIGIFAVLELLFLVTIPEMALALLIIFVPYFKESRLFQKQEKKATAKVENKNWKESGQKAAKKFVSRMKAEEAMEKEFKSHPHTPMAYSYDSCAKEKRLEQIRTLRNAGLLTEAEYKQRRSSILAEK